MARVALIKIFTGLNLGVSQLSGEFQRAGHDTRIIYFKDFLAVPVEDAGNYEVTWHAKNLASGTYLCRLNAGAFERSIRMSVLK